jgi:hypothetical protein
MVPGDYRTFWFASFILLLIFMIVLSNGDISTLYLVQPVDCGVYHHCDPTAAVSSCTMLHTAACSYIHCPGKIQTESDQHISKKGREKRKYLPPS